MLEYAHIMTAPPPFFVASRTREEPYSLPFFNLLWLSELSTVPHQLWDWHHGHLRVVVLAQTVLTLEMRQRQHLSVL